MGIYVVSHKPLSSEPELIDGYMPFFVGPNRELLSAGGGVVDGFGENIAELNSSFCELTALYWVWKNCNDSQKGIVHYRRFFKELRNRGSLIKLDDAVGLLGRFDLILPEKYWLLNTVERHYASHHNDKDLKLLMESVASVQPDYLEAFDECMKLHYVYPYNMLIANAGVYDAYCEWLFSIMFNLRDSLAASGGIDRDTYQSRVYGFLSERLMNVYVIGSGVKIFEAPVLLTEQNLKRSVSMGLASLLFSKGSTS